MIRRLMHHPFIRRHVAQGWRFVVCGLLGATIDLGSTAFLVEFADIDPHIAYIPSTLLAVIFVFMANKFFTFKNRESDVGRQALKFAFVYGAAIVSNLTISWTLLWLGLHYIPAKIGAIGVGAVWNYTMSHGFVFRKREQVDVVV